MGLQIYWLGFGSVILMLIVNAKYQSIVVQLAASSLCDLTDVINGHKREQQRLMNSFRGMSFTKMGGHVGRKSLVTHGGTRPTTVQGFRSRPASSESEHRRQVTRPPGPVFESTLTRAGSEARAGRELEGASSSWYPMPAGIQSNRVRPLPPAAGLRVGGVHDVESGVASSPVAEAGIHIPEDDGVKGEAEGDPVIGDGGAGGKPRDGAGGPDVVKKKKGGLRKSAVFPEPSSPTEVEGAERPRSRFAPSTVKKAAVIFGSPSEPELQPPAHQAMDDGGLAAERSLPSAAFNDEEWEEDLAKDPNLDFIR